MESWVKRRSELKPELVGPRRSRTRLQQPLTDPLMRDDASRAKSRIFENEIGNGDPLANVDLYLSPENAARFLDVSRKFIYEMIARREIEAVTVGGRLRRIRISTLEKWLKRSNERL